MEKRKNSVLALLAYCLSTTFAAGLALAIILATATAAFGPSLEASTAPLNTPQQFSGMITDTHCGARHSQNSGQTSGECTRSCVRHGAKYMLVDGDATYILTGNPEPLEALAGERARITGTLEGDVLNVSAVAAQ